MADEIDYKKLLIQYIQSVIEDDYIVGWRCCTVDYFLGKPKDTLILMNFGKGFFAEVVGEEAAGRVYADCIKELNKP